MTHTCDNCMEFFEITPQRNVAVCYNDAAERSIHPLCPKCGVVDTNVDLVVEEEKR